MLRRIVLLLLYFWALCFGKTAGDELDRRTTVLVTDGTLIADCDAAALLDEAETNVSWTFKQVNDNSGVYTSDTDNSIVYPDNTDTSMVYINHPARFYREGWNKSGELHCETLDFENIWTFQIVMEKDFKRINLIIHLENEETRPRTIKVRYERVGGDFIRGWRMVASATSVINGTIIDSVELENVDVEGTLILRNVLDEGGEYNVSVALWILDLPEHQIRASELTFEFEKIEPLRVECEDSDPENNEDIRLQWRLRGGRSSEREFLNTVVFIYREKRKNNYETFWETKIKSNNDQMHHAKEPIATLMKTHSAFYIGICAILVRKSDPNPFYSGECCKTPIFRTIAERRALTETPQMLQANVSMDATVDVSFEPVPRYKLFGTDDGCQPSDGRCERKDLSPEDQAGKGLVTFTFQGKSNTYYFVRARCASNGKPGPFTEWLRIRTRRPEVPRPPVKLRESTSAKLKMKLRAGWRIGIGWRTYMKSSGKAVNPKVIDRIEVTRTRHYSDGTYGKPELIPIKSRSDTFVSPAYTFSLGCYVYTVKVYFPAMTYVTASEELCFDMLSASYGILYLTILLISILFISFKMATQERPQDYAPQRYTRIRY
ncbi:hypothetical protein Q1695_010318 [Nippostrongylus brasiliensis]|nr:hypothetical protein Q1695_010318 [Nippostrongylus brasiliensis]